MAKKIEVGLKELPLRQEIQAQVDALAEATAPPAPPRRRFRVSLQGVKVRVVCPRREIGLMQDHLDVEAADAQGALEEFARYNGIPWKVDPLTNERRLASEHRPEALELTGQE
jgi:hypothetical protein